MSNQAIKWEQWVKKESSIFSEETQLFLKQAEIVHIGEKIVVFEIDGREAEFKKVSDAIWTIPSSLLFKYGSLTSIFSGLNKLLND